MTIRQITFGFLKLICYLCIRNTRHMIVKANKVQYNPETDDIQEINYDLHIQDREIIKGITVSKFPTYWYALIDGKLFKSDQRKGLKSIYFSSKDELEDAISQALYWRRKLVPEIGCGVGYDCEDFYLKLKQTHNIEFKQVKF